LIALDPADSQWSIMRILSGRMSAAEVICTEHTEMLFLQMALQQGF
jgi:hypothetical protein